uniref:HTH myb-type domain-containing protein n=1 Tax=Oryza punctata TaxID=4537 RepID=A0A0E0K085_ORYPU
MHTDATATGNGGAATPGPAAAEPPAPSAWTRRDEKLLEMLLWLWQLNPPWDRVAAELGDKTATQAFGRYVCLSDELRLVMEAPAVQTPLAWDMHEQEAAMAVPPPGLEAEAAAGGGEVAGMTAAVVVAGQAADVAEPTGGESAEVTAIVTSPHAATRAPTIGGGVELKSRELKIPRKARMTGGGPRKKAEMWTKEEHSQFLHGIGTYGKGKWKTLARDFVKTKSSTQIASHYQKFCIRVEKRRLSKCKRASIHDIVSPTAPAPATATAPESAAGPSAPCTLIESGLLIAGDDA